MNASPRFKAGGIIMYRSSRRGKNIHYDMADSPFLTENGEIGIYRDIRYEI